MRQEELHRFSTAMPKLHTNRLLLRKILPCDTKDMYAYSSLDEVTKYLSWDTHPNVEHTSAYISYLQERYAMGDFYDWALIDQATDTMIGTVGYTSFDLPNNCAEIGYVLHPDFRGQGLVPEAVNAILQFGFEKLHLSRISAICMKENAASLRVMQKCGMKCEGLLRSAVLIKGLRRDIYLSAILAEEYFSKKQKKGD